MLDQFQQATPASAPDTRDALASTIGARVRRERLSREWTLDQLSEATGISRRQVVNVEQGDANPSIGTLLKLSQALGLTLSSLVELPSSPTAQITRAGEGARLWLGEHGGTGILLAAAATTDVVELWDWRMNAGDRHESAAHTHGSRELLHVHSGVITLEVAGARHELSAGDAITFSGDVPHAYANEGDTSAQFSLSVYEPHSPNPRERQDTHA